MMAIKEALAETDKKPHAENKKPYRFRFKIEDIAAAVVGSVSYRTSRVSDSNFTKISSSGR
jgi:hypothetical protein